MSDNTDMIHIIQLLYRVLLAIPNPVVLHSVVRPIRPPMYHASVDHPRSHRRLLRSYARSPRSWRFLLLFSRNSSRSSTGCPLVGAYADASQIFTTLRRSSRSCRRIAKMRPTPLAPRLCALQGFTPLHRAVAASSAAAAEIVRALLKAPGIDVNVRTECGYQISNNVRVCFAALTVQ